MDKILAVGQIHFMHLYIFTLVGYCANRFWI